MTEIGRTHSTLAAAGSPNNRHTLTSIESQIDIFQNIWPIGIVAHGNILKFNCTSGRPVRGDDWWRWIVLLDDLAFAQRFFLRWQLAILSDAVELEYTVLVNF